MTIFNNKYRSESARLRGYDYAQTGAYFVTICTFDRIRYFGEIIDDVMNRSEIGKIAEREWIVTPQIRPDMQIEMDAFVVMPNHIHGIIVIGINPYNTPNRRDATHRVPTNSAPTIPDLSGNPIPDSPPNSSSERNKFAPQSNNLASIIRGYKSAVTVGARKIIPGFAWQPRFYDHIIRNETELNRIREYIANNPQNWGSNSNNLQKM